MEPEENDFVTDKRFTYKALGKLVNINTLSPNGNYYYKIQSPREINMGNYGGKIAFYEKNKTLLYHRNDCIAHGIPPGEVIEFVSWSRQGNMAHFYEFKRNYIYDIVFLDFDNNISFRLNQLNNDEFKLFYDLNVIGKAYDEKVVRTILIENDIKQEAFYKDEIIKPTLLEMIFRKTRWYPRV